MMTLTALVLAAGLVSNSSQVAALATVPIRPDDALTPGLVATTNTAAVCTPGYAAAHRTVSQKTKLSVYAAYGLVPAGRFRTSAAGARVWQSDFEVDHRVSLQLGGSNLPANLWVQSYRTRRYNATSKDALENRLHWLVCAGTPRLPLVEAQRLLLGDWIEAFDRYLTPR